MTESTNANDLSTTAERSYVLGWLVLAAALVFYLLTLRSGHRAGDFAMYAQHTVNMAEGRPYAETGYFQNPASPSVGTKNYPPGLPVLLLPVYLVVGLNVTAMKALMVLLFVAALYVFWRLTRDHMAAAFAAVMLFDIAFTPYLWAFKDNVESDFPFLLPLLLSLWLISRSGVDTRDRFRWVALGAVMYAAVVIRPIGLALPISLLLYDVIDRKRIVPSLRFWVPTVTLVALIVAQGVVLPLESGSYASAFLQEAGSPAQLLGSMIRNAKFYILACAGRLLLTNGHGTLWADSLLALSLAPFVVGFVKRIRDRIGILDVFFVVYAGILLVWPFRQPNYLIPAIPILSYYVFVGIERLTRRLTPKSIAGVALGTLALLVVTFGMNYSTLDFKNVPHDVMSPASLDFYERIKETTAVDAVILSRLPREIAFFTGRRSTPPNLPSDNQDSYSLDEVIQLLDYNEHVSVAYAAAGPRGPHFHREILPLWDLAEQTPEIFNPIFANTEWRLYAVHTEGTGVNRRPDDE